MTISAVAVRTYAAEVVANLCNGLHALVLEQFAVESVAVVVVAVTVVSIGLAAVAAAVAGAVALQQLSYALAYALNLLDYSVC